jgi:phosphatidylglycerophosphate synthase
VNQIPAVLAFDAGAGNLSIAGLTIYDRLVINAHRAGCAPILIVSENAPPLKRAEALGIAVQVVSAAPQPNESSLMITGPVLVEACDLERVIARGGQLSAKDGFALPVQMNVPEPPLVVAEGLAAVVDDARAARAAERQLWTAIGSSADGLVDRYFNRPVGRLLSKALVNTPVTPNQVSLASSLIGLLAAWLFADVRFLAGALVLQLSAIVDCVDGDLARARYQQSNLGKWLDLGGDQVVHFSIFAALGIGLMRVGFPGPALLLGLSAAVGVIISFIVIVRAMNQTRGLRHSRLEKLIDATTNRDFSVLLIVLACLGRIDLFLWMAGLGVHLFWITALALQTRAVGATAART